MQDIKELRRTRAGVHEITDRLVGLESEELQRAFGKRREAAEQRLKSGETESLTIKETRRIGRNDPCPCGSKEKFKKCCGARLAANDDRIKD
jgi:uncharacterized protein YecA (UPF0149 family)